MATPVEPIDPTKKSSDITGPTSDEATVSMDLLDAKCLWNDVEYSQGAEISTNGKSYVCSFGRWIAAED